MTRLSPVLRYVGLFVVLAVTGCGSSPGNPVAAVDTHTVSLVVTDPVATLDEIRGMAVSMNGKIDGWSLMVNAFPYLGVKADQASISLRVPPDHIDEALSRITDLANEITYCRMNRRDIAEEYEELRIAVRELEIAEAELLQSLEAASTLQEATAAAEQLFGVQGELFAARSRIAHMEEEASLIIVSVDLLPVEVGPIEAPGPCSHVPPP